MAALIAVASPSSARTKMEDPHMLFDVFSEKNCSSFIMATAAAVAVPPPPPPPLCLIAETASFASFKPLTMSHASSAMAAAYALCQERRTWYRVARSGLKPKRRAHGSAAPSSPPTPSTSSGPSAAAGSTTFSTGDSGVGSGEPKAGVSGEDE
jgi:hypothetical protein